MNEWMVGWIAWRPTVGELDYFAFDVAVFARLYEYDRNLLSFFFNIPHFMMLPSHHNYNYNLPGFILGLNTPCY